MVNGALSAGGARLGGISEIIFQGSPLWGHSCSRVRLSQPHHQSNPQQYLELPPYGDGAVVPGGYGWGGRATARILPGIPPQGTYLPLIPKKPSTPLPPPNVIGAYTSLWRPAPSSRLVPFGGFLLQNFLQGLPLFGRSFPRDQHFPA